MFESLVDRITNKEKLSAIEERLSNIEQALISLQSVRKQDKSSKLKRISQEHINLICSMWDQGEGTRKISDALKIQEDIVYRVIQLYGQKKGKT